MRESAERVKYITDYLCSYKTKIEALNKNGLLDTAILYELFATEICKLWFGQSFRNLNTERSNYPYVDLVSEDGTMYVQVSTGQDIPHKVKSTLEGIRDSSDPAISKIFTLYFFVLGNESIERLPEYTGEKRIGYIDFYPKTHLITIADIICKAKTDLEFQLSLYGLLQKESEAFHAIAEKLDEMVSLSREIISTDICGVINGEYEISRDDIIRKIKIEDFHFITIIGDAGSGKSALCKKLISEESLILFARAEKIAEVSDVDQIWGMSVSNLLRYLNGKRIVIYIDALEFIADGRKTNIDLLHHLYVITSGCDNAHIVTSCRTSDKNAFFRLTSAFEIHEYAIPELTDSEIREVSMRYPIVRDLLQQNRYSQILRSPFYLNMIVEQVKSSDDLRGTNGLRGFIWDNVICLNNEVLPVGITSDDIRDAVNKIVISRAKEFLIGIPKDDIPHTVLRILESKGVVLQTNEKLRLKYDIFEDICFEQLFDREFERCKGDYCAFFSNLVDFGRCVYRRYQIWVENKLFVKEGRESFLYTLVSSDVMPEEWKKQTIIGITKSKFCKEFFSDYGTDLIARGQIKEFFAITNLYSFETSTLTISNGNHFAVLRPIGIGREQLIQMVKDHKLYEEPVYKDEIIKLCKDYSQGPSLDEHCAKEVCEILETYIDQAWKEALKASFTSIDEDVFEYLGSLYLMAEYCKDWLRSFWQKVLDGYRTDPYSNRYRLSGRIVQDTLKKTPPALVKALPVELTELAWAYWVEKPAYIHDSLYHSFSNRDSEELYGLNENASHYSYSFRTAETNAFLRNLTYFQVKHALFWAIKLTNYTAEHLHNGMPDEIKEIELIEFSNKKKYSYWFHPNFFFVGIQEHKVPELIGDTVYTLRKTVFEHIENHLSAGNSEYCTRFVNWLKKTIMDKSNNTMLLDLVEDIGLVYPEEFPGYSVLFASSIDYVMSDSDRQLAQMGMSRFWGERYQSHKQTVLSLTDYILKTQLLGHSEDRALCEKTLDYLYSIIPNDEDHAVQHLQIQKMDLRKAEVAPCVDGYCLVPQVTGAAEEVVKNYENSQAYKEKSVINRLEHQYIKTDKGRGMFIDDCLAGIKELESILASPYSAVFVEPEYVKYIACALSKDELDMETRSKYCQFWIDRLNRNNGNGPFVFDIELVHILFEQAGKDLNESTKAELKRLFLTILLNRNQNGLLSHFGDELKQYLETNDRWAKILFNTVLELAKDEMAHNLFNADYFRHYSGDTTFEYQPNISEKLDGVDYYIKTHRGKLFQSSEEEIIQKYLLNEEQLQITSIDVNYYDITVLCRLANCGLSLSNEEFCLVIKAILHQMILIWYADEKNSRHTDLLDSLDEAEVSDFLKKELLYPEKTDAVLELLFSEADYSLFVNDTFEFYENVLIGYLPYYVDAYDNAALRREYKKLAEKIENRVKIITNEEAKIRLYRVLFLPSLSFYHGDWSGCKTKYSYSEKQFINSLWEKYGKYHLNELLAAIYELHIRELIPEVLPGISTSFIKADEERTSFVDLVISKNKARINEIITTAFIERNDQIKQNGTLTAAFESFLELLIEYNIEVAAVILDEFRIH